MKLNAKYSHFYRKAVTGNVVFVYHVNGSADALQAYQDAQANNYKEDDATGKPLWFTSDINGFPGQSIELLQTSNGNFILDNSAATMQVAQVKGMFKQFAGVPEMQAHLGGAIAQALAANLFGTVKAPVALPAENAAE